MNRVSRFAIALVAVSVAPSLAGTPLPDPPFSNGGFIPPSSLDLRLETYVGKSLLKYATNSRKCDIKAVIALQLAYEPENTSKVPELQTKWQLCKQKVSDRYAYERDLLILKGTPACLDQAAIDAIRAQIDANLASTVPGVFCDGDAAAPDSVTGLNIPDFKPEAEGEGDVAKVLIKVGGYAYKCYVSALKYAFKFAGNIPAYYQTKIADCFARAQAKSDDAMATLDQRQKLPGCISLAAAQAAGTDAIAFPGELTDENYCASPSGAFVD